MKAKRTSFPRRLVQKAKRGFTGFPVATIAFCGPDDRFASKVAVGIVGGEGEEALGLERPAAKAVCAHPTTREKMSGPAPP